MRKALLAAAAIAALASASATAQTTTTDNPPNGASADKMSPTGTPGMGANPTNANPSTTAPANAPQTATQPVPKDGPSFIQVQSADMLTSNVVELDIYNSQNDDIGKVQDIAFELIEEGDRLHPVRRRLPRHGQALCRGQSRCADGELRRSEQGLEGDHERHQGPAQVGSRIQVRGPVDGEQKLSSEVGRSRVWLRLNLKQSEEERPWLIEQRISITSGS